MLRDIQRALCTWLGGIEGVAQPLDVSSGQQPPVDLPLPSAEVEPLGQFLHDLPF